MIDMRQAIAVLVLLGLAGTGGGCGSDPCVDSCENAKELDCPNFSIQGDCGALCDAFGDAVDEEIAQCQADAADCDAYQACGN